MGRVDSIYHNARIYTVDPEDSTAEAIAVAGERIVAIGSRDMVGRAGDSQTSWVDLEGRTVIPGIVDSHNHVITAGIFMAGVLLFSATSIGQLQELLAARVAEAEPGQWVLGGGWIENQFDEWRMPTRDDLDPVSPHNPVLLSRLFGMSLVNSRALELAGIGRDTPDPHGGSIDRDPATGAATGILRGTALELVRGKIPLGDSGQQLGFMRDCILRAGQEYLRWGITSVIDPGVTPLGMRAYQGLLVDGLLPLRVNMMPVWHGLRAGPHQDELAGRIDHLGVYTGFGDHWLKLGALKMAVDGGLGSQTSLMYEPYLDKTKSQVPLRLDIERLQEYIRAGHQAGWSIGIHTCGDLAQDRALEAFDAVVGTKRDTGLRRHNIIHGYFPTERALELMAQHRIAVSAQPGFIWVEGDLYLTAVSEEKAASFTPLRTYIDHGILVAANSDMTSAHYNPFWGMHSALTRTTSRGRVLGPDECLSRAQTLRAFTLNGAALAGEERLKGSLEVGKLADFAVLDRDIMRVPDQEIRDTRVLTTVLGGKVVHSDLAAK